MAWIATANDPGFYVGPTYNIGLTTYAQGYFILKSLLKTMGATIQASGDGLAAFSSPGDVLTNYGSGANRLGNSKSYFVARWPTGQAFGFQFTNGTGQRRVKYSSNGFSLQPWNGTTYTGAANSTTMPGHTVTNDLVNFAGNADDTTPTGTGADASLIFNAVVGDGTGGTPRSLWWSFTTPGNFGSVIEFGFLDFTTGFGHVDADLAVSFMNTGFSFINTNYFSVETPAAQQGYNFMNRGTLVSPARWVLAYWSHLDVTDWDNNAGAAAESGRLIELPLLWHRTTAMGAPSGPRGYSSLFTQPALRLNVGQAYDVAGPGAKDYVQFAAGYVLPWIGDTLKP